MRDTIRELLGFGPRPYLLTTPRTEETEGLLILGDTGTGKSQMLHQLIRNILQRDPFESIVCFDPVGEFTEKFYDPDRDVIWNPLDARSHYWEPSNEFSTSEDPPKAAERRLIAESFFPLADHLPPSAQFFPRAAQSLFAQILKQRLTPEEIVEILSNEELIDRCVAHTEVAHLIDRGAKAQRGGVLASVSEAGESFRLLPSRCKYRLSLREWADRRSGGILFITSTHSDRSALRLLQAAILNILFTHLLGEKYGSNKYRSCWVIIDEVHTLRHLPILKTVLVEGRKAGIKLVMGTHNKAQFEEHYGKAAATMLAAPHAKAFLRTNETESARWVSEMIGDEEKEERRLSTTASVQKHGRDSIHYANSIERRAVVSKEQIMSLPNLHGYWKYGDAVVPFRIEPQSYPSVARAFIPRQQSSSNAVVPPNKPTVNSPTHQVRTPSNGPAELADGVTSQAGATLSPTVNEPEQPLSLNDEFDLNF